MVIYVPAKFGTFGKDIPGMPNQRFISGPGRAGTIVRGITRGYQFVRKYRKQFTHASTLTAGAVASSGGLDIEGPNNINKALRPIYRVQRGKRHRNRKQCHKCCSCCK